MVAAALAKEMRGRWSVVANDAGKGACSCTLQSSGGNAGDCAAVTGNCGMERRRRRLRSVGWGNVDKSSRFAVLLQNRLVLHSFYFFFFR